MAAQSEARSGRGGCLLALLAVAAAIALIAVPALNQHALERHGWHAVSAARQFRRHTPEPQDEDRYWNGTDAQGREIHVLRLPQVAGRPVTWAILILGGGGAFVVTAFLVQSRRSVERIKGKCR